LGASRAGGLVPILTPDDLKALLAMCRGRTFADWRDTVIIWLFVDTGMRLAEMTGLSVDDLNMDTRSRWSARADGPARVQFGAKTGHALDCYLRVRRRHRHAKASALWIGDGGFLRTTQLTRPSVSRPVAVEVVKGMSVGSLQTWVVTRLVSCFGIRLGNSTLLESRRQRLGLSVSRG
jgi:site-specific recombinase XerC